MARPEAVSDFDNDILLSFGDDTIAAINQLEFSKLVSDAVRPEERNIDVSLVVSERQPSLNVNISQNISVNNIVNEEYETDTSVVCTQEMQDLAFWGLPPPVLERYHKNGIRTMFPWQVECLRNPQVLSGKNLVYSAPTSAGKTLVAELLAIKTVLEKKKKAIIILPFVSVVREKMFYLQDLLATSGVRVEGLMGSHSMPGGFKSVDVAVCTIEKANGLINRLMEEGSLHKVGVVVVDELHLLGDPFRGYLLELLITKIRYMSTVNEAVNVQLIGMSATLPNLDLLASWLDAHLYKTDFRPIPLNEFMKVGQTIYNKNVEIHGTLKTRFHFQDDPDHVVHLCLDTILEGFSCLIFCPTKNWCEKLAKTIAKELYTIGKSGSDVASKLRAQLKSGAIAEALEQLKRCPVGLDPALGQAIAFGVGFHHAGLTIDERDIIEELFRSGVIRVLTATSTLSSGVNLPARRVLIRTPVFHRKPLDVQVYQQMVGRAGRMGKDSAGESFLLCSKNEQKIGEQLLKEGLKPISSCLGHGELSSSLKRAILEVVASRVAETPDEVNSYTGCTLLAASHSGLDNPIQSCIKFLIENEFIRLQVSEDGITKYIPTPLGQACLAASMSPDDGLELFQELQKARQCFVLENELHLIYLVTPYSVAAQWANLDWLQIMTLWEKLPPGMRRVGELIGVDVPFMVRALRGTVNLQDYKQLHKLTVHRRFYTALALQDLVNEVPLKEVAANFQCSKGMLQSLQQTAATFAGMVTAFCRRLGWANMELLVSQFQDRLQFGVHRELCDLMRLDLLNGPRARALFNAGITSLADLAAAKICEIENALHKSVQFESAKNIDGETEYDTVCRNQLKTIWITGRQGLTEREAAKLLIEEARRWLQEELGLADAKWNPVNTQGNDSSDPSLECQKVEEDDVEDKALNVKADKSAEVTKYEEKTDQGVETNSSGSEHIKKTENCSVEVNEKRVEDQREEEEKADDHLSENNVTEQNELDVKVSDGDAVAESSQNSSSAHMVTVMETPPHVSESLESQETLEALERKINMKEDVNESRNSSVFGNLLSRTVDTKSHTSREMFETSEESIDADEEETSSSESIKLESSVSVALSFTPTGSEKAAGMDINGSEISASCDVFLGEDTVNQLVNTFQTSIHANSTPAINKTSDLSQSRHSLDIFVSPEDRMECQSPSLFGESLLIDTQLCDVLDKSVKRKSVVNPVKCFGLDGNVNEKQGEKFKYPEPAMKSVQKVPVCLNSEGTGKKYSDVEDIFVSKSPQKGHPVIIKNPVVENPLKKKELIYSEGKSEGTKANSILISVQEKNNKRKSEEIKENNGFKPTSYDDVLTESFLNQAFTSVYDFNSGKRNRSGVMRTVRSKTPLSIKCRSNKKLKVSPSCRLLEKRSVSDGPVKYTENNHSCRAKLTFLSDSESDDSDLVPSSQSQCDSVSTFCNRTLKKKLEKSKSHVASKRKKNHGVKPRAENIDPKTDSLEEVMYKNIKNMKNIAAVHTSDSTAEVNDKDKPADLQMQVSDNESSTVKTCLPVPNNVCKLNPVIKNCDLEIKPQDVLSTMQMEYHESNNGRAEESVTKKRKRQTSWKKLEIINLCDHRKVFEAFKKEIKDHTLTSFSVACEKYVEESTKTVIGDKILGRKNKAPDDSKKALFYDRYGVLGVAMCIGGCDAYYLALDSAAKSTTQGIISFSEQLEFLESVMTYEDGMQLSAFDIKEQYKILHQSCGITIGKEIFDPKVAHWLLDSESPESSLQSLVLRYAPDAMKVLKVVGNISSCRSLGLSIGNSVGGRLRACVEAIATWHITSLQLQTLNKNILKLYREVEMPTIMCLARIELGGIGFSHNVASTLYADLQKYISVVEERAYKLAGHMFSLSSLRDVSKVLFKELNLKSGKLTSKKKPSTSKEVLLKLKHVHPLPALILEWRKITYILSNIVLPFLKVGTSDRIFGCYVTHTATGRISMHEPNLQSIPRDFNISINEKETKIISMRCAFIPKEGKSFISADYSQLELRILAHLSQDETLVRILKSGADVFRSVAASWNEIPESEVTDNLRQRAKQVCYGVIYGIGASALSEELDVLEEEATAFMETFLSAYPALRKFRDEVIHKCREKGYVETLSGRKRFLPSINNTNIHARGHAERQAVNSTVQGSAADIAKTGMVLVEASLKASFPNESHSFRRLRDNKRWSTDSKFASLVLHLHDELLYEVSDAYIKEVAHIIKGGMEAAASLSVPLPVKVKCGKSWGSLKELVL